MAQAKLYKIVGHQGEAINGGRGTWFLPKGKRPGKWMPDIKGKITPCKNGYHLCHKKDLVEWLTNGRIFEAEYRGELGKGGDKVVVRQARLIREMNWNDKTARLFAADCAERVLHLYEKRYPDDARVRNCIEVARRVANGDLPVSELAAARAAAEAAAGDAAWAAAGAAARAADETRYRVR